MDPHPQPMPDQARGYGVEHLAQDEAAARGDEHGGLVEVGGPLSRQRAQRGALELDELAPTRVAPADQLGNEAAIGVEIGKVARAAQQQRLIERLLEVAVVALDDAVLVRHAAVVAARHHAVVSAQRLVALGVRSTAAAGIEVAERGRERVGAVLARRTAERPQRVLQTVRQGGEALAAEHHLGMLPTRVGECEVVEAVLERLAGDCDAEPGRVGEVGQRPVAGRMDLAEDDLALGPVPRLPGPDAPLEGATMPTPVAVRMAALPAPRGS